MRLFLALVVLALAAAVAAEEEGIVRESTSGPVTARVRVSPAAPAIGDAVLLELEVAAEAGVEVLLPRFGEALDRFTIVAFAPSESVADDGATIARQRYTLQASRSGTQTIPALLVEFVDRRPGKPAAPEGQDAFELLTERIDFTVSSVLPEDAPLDLRPSLGALPARVDATGTPWPWIALAVVLAIAVPFAVRAWIARNALRRRASAYDLARGELDALLYGPRPDAVGMDAFFVKLSGVIRRYLEDRFGLRSPELTTEEFLAELSHSPDLLRAHQALLRGFLERADLVKFAHYVPESADVEESIAGAQRFLEETRVHA